MADPKKPRTVKVTTDSAGHVTGLVTPAGTSVGYGYTGDALTTVTDPRGNPWTYGHDGPLLSGISVRGSQRLHVTYTGAGRVATLQRTGSPDHADLRFDWDATSRTATRRAHVSVDGELTWVDYVDRYVGNSLVRQEFPTGAVVRYAYDARTNLVRVQDPAGWVQEMAYNAAGNLTQQRSPMTATTAAVVKLTYDGDSRVLTETDANGNTVTYVYSGPGLGSITPTGGGAGSARLTYNSLGLLTAVVTPTGRQVFGYDEAGNQTRVQAETLPGTPLTGAGSAATYDEAGRVRPPPTRAARPARSGGFTTSNTYDKAGNLLTTVSPAGEARTTPTTTGQVMLLEDLPRRDVLLVERERPHPQDHDRAGTAVQQYDPSGSVLVDTTPTGRQTRHRYDALGRETVTDTESATVRYAFDASSNVVGIDDSDGVTTSRQFDSLNRLVRSVTGGAETLSRYDADGNLLTERDPRGNTTTRSYDSRGNLTAVTDPAGHHVVRDHPPRTSCAGPTAGAAITTYTYDGLGHVLSRWPSTAARRRTANDEAGNACRTTDPSGRVTTRTLDGANRTTGRTTARPPRHHRRRTRPTTSWGRRTSVTSGGTTATSRYDTRATSRRRDRRRRFTYDHATARKDPRDLPRTARGRIRGRRRRRP